MAGLDPAIHDLFFDVHETWIPATSAGMTIAKDGVMAGHSLSKTGVNALSPGHPCCAELRHGPPGQARW
jgi:hypothetical protein